VSGMFFCFVVVGGLWSIDDRFSSVRSLFCVCDCDFRDLDLYRESANGVRRFYGQVGKITSVEDHLRIANWKVRR